jgi:hypothetical protein
MTCTRQKFTSANGRHKGVDMRSNLPVKINMVPGRHGRHDIYTTFKVFLSYCKSGIIYTYLVAGAFISTVYELYGNRVYSLYSLPVAPFAGPDAAGCRA